MKIEYIWMSNFRIWATWTSRIASLSLESSVFRGILVLLTGLNESSLSDGDGFTAVDSDVDDDDDFSLEPPPLFKLCRLAEADPCVLIW